MAKGDHVWIVQHPDGEIQAVNSYDPSSQMDDDDFMRVRIIEWVVDGDEVEA